VIEAPAGTYNAPEVLPWEQQAANQYKNALKSGRARLGQRRATGITRQDIEDLRDWMLTEGRRRGGKPGGKPERDEIPAEVADDHGGEDAERGRAERGDSDDERAEPGIPQRLGLGAQQRRVHSGTPQQGSSGRPDSDRPDRPVVSPVGRPMLLRHGAGHCGPSRFSGPRRWPILGQPDRAPAATPVGYRRDRYPIK